MYITLPYLTSIMKHALYSEQPYMYITLNNQVWYDLVLSCCVSSRFTAWLLTIHYPTLVIFQVTYYRYTCRQNRPLAWMIFFASSNPLSNSGWIIGWEVSMSSARSPDQISIRKHHYFIDRSINLFSALCLQLIHLQIVLLSNWSTDLLFYWFIDRLTG